MELERLRKRRWLRALLLSLSLLAAAGCAFLLLDPWDWLWGKGKEAVSPGPFPGVVDPPLFPEPGPFPYRTLNVLILGLDHGLGRPEEGNRRSDVIMVVHLDLDRQKACLLSIPRDSYVDIPGHGRSKINEAYALGGAELARRTVEEVTGMRMDRHLALDFDEFRWLVDLFGGIPITLEKPISDPKLGNIAAGSQVLDGNQALIMARSRDYPQGDLMRVRQQQRLIIQALYQGKKMAGYPGAAWFLYAALDSLDTDLTRDELIRLAREFASFPVVDVQGGVAPG
ncbi:MAG: LCP family protein, partial [Actinomycetota bacterium]|nr:LCP family protein [Actinomycetota bacterium]